MKKSFTILMMAAMLLLSGLGWAQTTAVLPNTQALTTEFVNVGEDENIQIKTSSANTYTNPLRFYANVTATIQAINDAQILSITYEASSTGNYVTNAQNASVTPQVDPTVNDKNVTWDYSSSPCTTFTFTPAAQTRCNSITIVYSINSSSVATPTFSPNGGTFANGTTQTITLSCATEGATIGYSFNSAFGDANNEWETYTGPIEVTGENQTKTIWAKATKEGMTESSVVHAYFQFVAPMTIAEVREQATGDVFTQGAVTSCVGTTGYIQDETAAICVYGTSLTVGDEIAVSGTLSTYNGLLEITSPVVDVISSGNTVEPTTMTIAEVNSSTNQGWYVRIENATVTEINGQNTTIAQGENTIVVRGISGIEYQVNDIISLNGNIGCHNDVAQIANPQNVTVQQSEEPAILVDPTTVNVPCAASEGTLTVTYQNIDEELGAEIYWYESDGTTSATYDWVMADFNENGNIDYIIDANTSEARTAYMKVYGIGTNGNDAYSELITFSQGHYVVDYATLPFEFDGGKADIEDTDGLTQEGLGTDYNDSPKLKFDSTGDCLILHFNEQPGTLTFDIKGNSFSGGTFTVQTSEDGETYTDLETYTELGSTQSESFDNLGENVRYIKWIYTEKSNGNVALGNITLAEYTGPVAAISVEPATIEAPVDGAEGTLTVTYQNITEVIADVYFCDADGEAANYDWIMAEINDENNVDYIIDANESDARTAYMKVYALDDNAEDVYSNLVTITQEAYVAPATGDVYALYTGELVEGDYVICYHNSTWTAAMKNTVESGRLSYEEILPNNSVVTTDDATIVWHIAQNGNYWTIYSVNANAYAAGTGVKNKAQMLEDGTVDFALWTITGTEAYDFVNKGNAAANVNAYLRNNTTYGFACYAEGTGGALSLYKKVVEPETHTLDIAGYGNSAGGYYLIASPVASVTPSTENGFLTEAYDLYEFDQSADNEWVNYEQHGFDIVSGKGYLYASQANTTLTFEGQPYNGNGKIDLVYDENANLAGWNLIGNPFGVTATVDHDYYIMNENGDNFMLTSKETPINAMQGIFIVTESADDNKAVFTTEEPATPGEKLVLNVTHNRGVVDRAMIRFGEGQQMPKAMMSPNNTKIYIEQANNDYAVVRSDNEGEMPVSFKAAANGTYTLSVDADNVEMDYLHLFDNMTGNDVDLLATPSYTFEANTTDYANRFKLVYKNTTSIEENGETFAYFNGENMIITNEGDAQLQVIDMTGRIVSTETLNGTATVQTNAAPGVYMLRLINGDNVKVQKIIIK